VEQVRAAAAADVGGMAEMAQRRRPTCQIDDFVVVPAARWPTTGARLLLAGLAEASQRGAVQAVVVTAHLDQPKREALRACGLELASEWWVTPQGFRQALPKTSS
jgi:hypothetical protein